MASNMNRKDDSPPVDQSAALRKCISLFKSAKNDNERFASLLLVTKLVKSSDIDGAHRRVLFDAIGFTFINRLLNTKSVPEDCGGGLYQSLAVAILACFATDQELVQHPQMVAKIPLFNQILSSPSTEKQARDDDYQILVSFSMSSRGSDALLSKETVKCLCEIISKEAQDSHMAWTVLLNMASYVSKEMWIKHPKDLINLLSFSTNKMRMLQNMDKFTTCRNLLALLSHAETQSFREAMKSSNTDKWIVDLCMGLKDILQGKVTTAQRDPALMLVSLVTDLVGCGLNWVFRHDAGSKSKSTFFILVVTSVSVEIRMILDDNSTEEIIEKATLLTSCYNILENIIACLITADAEDDNHNQSAESPPRLKLDQGMISKLYTQVTEAMMSVLAFLQQEAPSYEAGEVSVEGQHLVMASVRVLCAWLAEESMALRKEVYKVLPFLIRLAKDTMESDNQDKGLKTKATKTVTFEEPMETESSEEKEPIEMLPFMLPALCHFSAHEESRKILMENHTHHILANYYSLLWNRCQNSTTSADSKTSLITLLGVLLNFAVTEPSLVKEDQSFLEIQKHVVANLPEIEELAGNVVVVAHLVVLGLMLTRHQEESNDLVSNPEIRKFFESSLSFLKAAKEALHSDEAASPLSITCQKDWKNISELWFLGVQVLKACAAKFQGCDVLVKEHRWLDDVQPGD